ncbi:MAG: hypothetical protein IPM24_16440 [Bryobacterales bacterium]|nr:hypothetical protein [Bryobacterales bacterium]
MLREASYYGKMTLGWWKFVRTPPAADARAAVRQGLADRQKNFLDLLRRVVFEAPGSPYRNLFDWAGYSYADVDHEVGRLGLETALEDLRRAGVYLTHDEFKGKTPIVRGSNRMEVVPEDFTNPLAKGVLEGSSSGSRSRGTVSPRSVEHLNYRETQESLYWDEFRVYDRSIVLLMQILPSSVGLRRAVGYLRKGARIGAWFTIGRASDAHYRAVTNVLVLESRMLGLRMPFPQPLPHNDFSPVARWIAQELAQGRPVAMMANVSSAVRVAAAAMELGLDIRGSQFFVGAEALSAAKQETIERAGATAHARYGCSEIGLLGMACPEMRGNCVHLMEDSVAAISQRKLAPLSQTEVNSLLFTTLREWAPLMLINAEMDDAGEIGPAPCECGLKRLGFIRQVDRIFSYGKLTGQGVTLMSGDLLNIIERLLPEKFGGVSTDYQLVEQEGAHQTELELRIHPRLGLRSEDAVRRYFVQELKKVYGGSTTERRFTHTDAFHIRFAEPHLTGGRKVLPLHLLGAASPPQ